jgi:hypothetical protein
MVNYIVKENFEDCVTSKDFELYFKEYNDLPCDNYCRLALRKLRNLSQEQKDDLNDIINLGSVNNRSGWEAYSYILTKEQILYVGW